MTNTLVQELHKQQQLKHEPVPGHRPFLACWFWGLRRCEIGFEVQIVVVVLIVGRLKCSILSFCLPYRRLVWIFPVLPVVTRIDNWHLRSFLLPASLLLALPLDFEFAPVIQKRVVEMLSVQCNPSTHIVLTLHICVLSVVTMFVIEGLRML
jgi:hypothetical protein